MKKFKLGKQFLAVCLAVMMVFGSYPFSQVLAASKETVDCTICNGTGKVQCVAEGCNGGKVEIDCEKCEGGYVDEECKTCDGTGLVDEETCIDCDGKKIVKSICTECNGTCKVKVNCSVCNGRGEIDCSECDGTGKVEIEYEICPDCDGQKEVDADCPDCNAAGFIQQDCEACQGTGKTNNTVDCDNCEGNGKVTGDVDCSDCGNTGKDGEEDCSTCSGTGKVSGDVNCNQCQGKGTVKVEDNCNTCNGKGKVNVTCQNCQQTGKVKVTCEKCKGTGKIVTICDDSFQFEVEDESQLVVKVDGEFSNIASSTNNTTGVVSYKSDNEEIATVAADGTVSALKKGEVKIIASIETDYVYSSKEIEYTLNIEKGVPEIESYQAEPIDYKETLADSSITATAKCGQSTVSGSVSWKSSATAPEVKDSGTTKYVAVFTPEDTSNYETVEFDATVVVNPIDITGIEVTGSNLVYDGDEHNAVSVTGYDSSDKVEYSTNGADYSESVPKVKDVKDTTTVYVKVTRNNNYNVFETSVSATINPAEIGGTHFSSYSGVYDGQQHDAVTITNPVTKGCKPVVTYIYNGQESETCPKFKDVGEYTLTVVLHNNYKEKSTDKIKIKAVITQRDLVVYTADEEVIYDAKKHTAVAKNATTGNGQLATGDSLFSCVADADYYSVDIVKNTEILVKNAVIKNTSNVDVTKNYNISYEKGKLTIKKRPVTITFKDVNATYTALPHPAKNYDYSESKDRYEISGLVQGHLEAIVFEGEKTEAGSYNELLTAQSYSIFDASDDVTNNYSVTLENGDLTIEYPVFDNYSYIKSDEDEGANDWYQKDVTIKANAGYEVCYANDDANNFSNTIVYKTEGVTKPKFAIKDIETGFISDVLEREEVKIDKTNPISFEVEYGKAVIEKTLSGLTFGVYKPSTNVTLKGTDETSKVSKITYVINEQSLEDNSWSSRDAVTVSVNNGISLQEFKTVVGLDGSFRGTIKYFVTDESGRTSPEVIGSKGIIVDSIAPKVDLGVDEYALYASKDTFATDFNFNVSVSDDNSGISGVQAILTTIEDGVEKKTDIKEDADGKLLSSYSSGNAIVSNFSFKVNTKQLKNRSENGKYVLNVKVTDNAGNDVTKDYEAYIDVYAPMITDFTFKSEGDIYASDSDVGKEVSTVDFPTDTTDYNFYFQKDTEVTVSACDFGEVNNHTAGIKDIDLVAVSLTGEEVYCEPIEKDSFVQSVKNSVGNSSKTFVVKGPFKGRLYARAVDYAGNYPTEKRDHGYVLDNYADIMSHFDDNKYDGYINPYNSIIENAKKHEDSSSITITPIDTPVSTQSYKYEYSYSSAQKDSEMSCDTTANVPLYDRDASFTINVKDQYSGIREVTWKVMGQNDQDQKNNQSETVKVSNLGELTVNDKADTSWDYEKESNSNLVVSMKKDITVKNNSNDIVILVILTDRAGNKSYDYYVLGIDKTKPEINVSVTGTASNGMYFNTDRTITVTVKERNFDQSMFNLAMSKNNVDISRSGNKLNWEYHSQTDPNATDDTVHTAVYTISKSSEGDYKLSASVTDRASNSNMPTVYDGSAPTKFVIDSTKPSIKVSMTGKSENEKYFFNTDRTVKIVVTDRNFDPKDVTLLINGKQRNIKAKLWHQDQSGVNRNNKMQSETEFVISAEGDYTFSVVCNDLADNESNKTKYANDDCERFTIDKTAPTVSISKVGYQSANNGKDVKGNDAKIPLAVTVKDKNIGNMYSGSKVSSKEISEHLKASTLKGTVDETTFAMSKESRETVTYSTDNIKDDGIYTLTLNIKDCAGNPVKVVGYETSTGGSGSQSVAKNGKTDFFTFSVNRNGSAFAVDKSTAKLSSRYYIKYADIVSDVEIVEINVDKLVNKNQVKNISIIKNGALDEKAWDYISVSHSSTAGSWNKYIYTIDKKYFKEEASYEISVKSKDEAKNTSYSDLKQSNNSMRFVVDDTVPVVSIVGISSNTSYFKDSQNVSISVSDDVSLNKVQILINDKIVLELEAKEFGDYFADGKFNWTDLVKSDEGINKIAVVCYDVAGNSNVDDIETANKSIVSNFLVTTDRAKIVKFWIINHVLPFVLICLGIAIVVAAIVFLVLRKKKTIED